MAAATLTPDEIKQYLDDREIYYLRHCFTESDTPDIFLRHYFHFRGLRPDVIDKLLELGKSFKRAPPAPVLPQHEIILPNFQIPKFSLDKPIRPSTVQTLSVTTSLPPSLSVNLPKVSFVEISPAPAPAPKPKLSDPINVPVKPIFPPPTSASDNKSAVSTYDFITGLRSGKNLIPAYLCKRYSPSEYFIENKQLYNLYDSWMVSKNSKSETSHKFYANFRRVGNNLILDRTQYTEAKTVDGMGNIASLF